MRTRLMLAVASFSLTLALFGATRADAAESHVLQNLKEVVWGAAPPFLPAGAQMAVVQGDPSAAALYTVRFKMPANYRIPAHSHPMDEHVVVESGTLFMGMGDKLDMKSGKALAVGGIGVMPADMNHFAYTKQPATIVLYGIGPVDFKYVDPADDPRNAAQK